MMISAGLVSAVAVSLGDVPVAAQAAPAAEAQTIGESLVSTPEARLDATDLLRERVRIELAARAPASRVELTGQIRWTRGSLPREIAAVTIINETARGEAIFTVRGSDATGSPQSEGWVTYAAWTPARIAIKRIQPGERLSPELFVTQDVNVAVGQARELRGLILDSITDVTRLEARQTVLEGQFLASNAVQRVPDVRRGDSVRIQLISGDLTLTTPGLADEPGYVDGQLRVMSAKTKRQLTGKLGADKTVEVRL